MKETILVIGGCRSGKSRQALELAEKRSEDNRVFIATCIPQDQEMQNRVAQHKDQRDPSWQTVETPVALPAAIRDWGQTSGVILVDCLTLWISNLFAQYDEADVPGPYVRELIRALETVVCPVIVVSNEVGCGIVPANRLARQFRDAVGFTNQRVAAAADRVVWMVAGIATTLKAP
jgi:adenosylcobinamide kinase/adenosylcobinamide-phosphate guanylyltransferase